MSPPAQSREGQDSIPSIFTGNQRSHGADPPTPSTPAPLSASEVSSGPRQPRHRESGSGAVQFESMSSDTNDRVFPIRSVVSVDPTPSTLPRLESGDSYFSQATARNPPSTPFSPTYSSAAELRRVRSGDESQQQREPRLSTEGSEGRRSVESADATSGQRSRPRKSSRGDFELGTTSHGYQIPSDNQSDRSTSVRGETARRSSISKASNLSGASGAEELGGLVTARFRHVLTDGGHAVITGRDGETLQRCEDEPIHIPGAIQSFGGLIALEEGPDGKLLVRVVSENSKRILGYTPRQLFALDSFTDILSDDQADNLLDHIDFVRDDGTDVEANGPEVFTMSIRDSQRHTHKLWCAIHVNQSNSKLIICEFELEDDDKYPLVPLHDETPEPPEDTLNSEPTEEELRESTEAHNRPLRMLRSARKRKGEAAAMEVFNIMSQVQDQLAQAPNLDKFLKVLVGVVKELTGFHRVMIYQFDHLYNGRVVTELVDPRATKDLYKGLHFPASDIPKQARDLYKVNKVRLLYDRDQETSRLVCRTVEDLESPLDLTHSYLRAMSPIHIKYLANMAVRSSMSISINAFNELWGLISCHAYGSKGTRVSFPIRKMCRLVGDSASRNIERLSYASRLQARKLINTSPTSTNPSGYIIASSDDLLSLFDADYGLLSIYDETKILGKLQATQEALAMLEYLRMRKFTGVITSHDIRFDFQDLRYPPGFNSIAGLLLVPLSSNGEDFIVFFRKGQEKEVKWAGNPYEKFIKQGTEGYLEPRKSFKTWTETVVGKCKEWTEEETETAGVLCLVYGKFIEVWRQKQAAMQNTELTKLLLQNSAHEVRTPLNAIINYLEVALEGSLDQETRENLSKSHSASKSLIYVINDLLDLTKTEASQRLIHEEAFSPSQSFHDAVDTFAGDARRKNITFEVVEDPELPEQVLGDPRRVRQAISNVTANAIEATSQGGVKIEMRVSARYERSVDIEVVVTDSGKGLPPTKLDDLFAELEQVQTETASASFIDTALESDDKHATVGEGKLKKRALGLGLAVVARIVRNMNGQLRLKSEEGKGSRFIIVFPFDLPPTGIRQPGAEGGSESTVSSSLTERPVVSTEGPAGDEVTLVAPGNRETPRRPAELLRKNSGGSMDSFASARSHSTGGSARSDVDLLIEAIQAPTQSSQRANSSDSVNQFRRSRVDSSSRKSQELSKRPRSTELKRHTAPAPHLRGTSPNPHGSIDIPDAKSPLRAIRMPIDSAFDSTGSPIVGPTVQSPPEIVPREFRIQNLDSEQLNVLVAEDDPINSKIVEKRLEKVGHRIFLTGNGEECSSRYCDRAGFFDVVLMDMQMPIVDGITSTKMIRSYEKANPSHALSTRASLNGRVPIFAVSASLVEKDRQLYIDAGFDGWILKPILFGRLSEIMRGLVDDEIRAKNVYKSGCWESGGWFGKAQPSVFEAQTTPDQSVPFTGPSKEILAAAASDADPGAQPPQEEAVASGVEGGPDLKQ